MMLEDVSVVIERNVDELRFGSQVIYPNQKTIDEYEGYNISDEEVIFPYED